MSTTDYAYVRTEMADEVPPPASEVGVLGWLHKNLFSSWSNTLLTLIGIYIVWLLVPPVIEFAFVNAVWTGENREACLAPPDSNVHMGACWAYVKAYLPQFIYGRYPDAERWRVNLVFFLFAIGLVPMLMPRVPFKRANIIYMLGAFPVVGFILLTGGDFDLSGFVFSESTASFWIEYLILTVVLAGVAFGIAKAGATDPKPMVISVLAGMAVIAAVLFLVSVDFGLAVVETEVWGGLLVTLVIAITGIVASLPLGIAFALGRRSKLPIIRLVSIIFIEFWRGVPLITVLFMSSVMLPLFLPEGVTFDKLLRALIGVALFAAAYMAEVVRGGLQAIPKGQYEGAQALGLGYWKMMGLIVLPQALKLVIPGIVNTFIGLFKDTTLVLIIGLFDLLGQVQSSYTDPTWSTPTQSHTGYMFAALVFWVFCFSMSRYSIYMEKRLHTGHRR
ncbi:amino acid ABC transporter permease [Microbaculum marinisediminis]|uniref:Amino acid ABC transporter permease n=1 Tax=Microbaculum marinisediminis TaxID=2931392 RepID=A0AAW5R2Q0_9HYPH|nr:amino acid ABC transporter permease [Microbaculum sp. A6E488]MCT8973118.1 amino acid ABC transporter permease [Microbaculum sp. A6E488]